MGAFSPPRECASSTRRLYALKWSVFSAWCSTCGADPEICDISLILSFLQELLEKGRSDTLERSTLKIYVAAIAASHAPIDGQWVGRNNLIVCFLKGSRRLNLPRPVTVLTWDRARALLSTPYSVQGSEEPFFCAATVCWPSSPDVKDRSATGTSIGKTYGRSASAISQPFLPRIRA